MPTGLTNIDHIIDRIKDDGIAAFPGRDEAE